MKAKKLLLIVLFAVLGTSAQSQIVSSRSDQVIVTEQVKEKMPKKPITFKWNLRVGYSFDMMMGANDLSSTSGFDGSLGIRMPFGKKNLFWGVEAGFMTYGAYWKELNTSCIIPVTYLNPHIGITFPVGQKKSFNLYGGPYVSYRCSQRSWYKEYEFNDNYDCLTLDLDIKDGADIGINIGAEFFVSKIIFFDLHVKKGFLPSGKLNTCNWYDYYDYWDDESKNISALKIVIGIGIQF